MPRYRVEVTYDMGMSRGGEVLQFEAADDEVAIQYMDDYSGGNLSLIKRDLQFRRGTLAKCVDQ